MQISNCSDYIEM